MSARDEILARVREALGAGSVQGSRPVGALVQGSPSVGSDRQEVTPERAPEPSAYRTPYRTESEMDEDGLVELLVDRLEDYKARVEVVARGELAGAIRKRLDGKRFVVPHGFPTEWLHPALADRAVTDSREAPIAVERLDALDAVVTSSAVSIAETGTIVLDGSPDQGRRAISLVPDHHVCVVPVETIAGIVPEGFARLDVTRPLTLISGPSATSDIELERVEGVHGPRMLDVIIAR
ncbi:LUD domain-containing protein [Sinomonas sp. ASV322]|uniref:LutC/YkgG family protein n=1 Tax=Sinomonas sp. ASV322 TaxID=3041920 RepID=UPI0027DC805C|nr:LUD domain-containing protein [Sinomonas sp. ASV322]MDQ4502589.1 LUD domain-containing protein [Sinomonas sp. ASV322]